VSLPPRLLRIGHRPWSARIVLVQHLTALCARRRYRIILGTRDGTYTRQSTMNMAALESYVYWTAKDLEWTWDKMASLAPKKRQPRGCRGSAAPGGRSRDAPVRQKRKPTAYNMFIKQYFTKNFEL
jgi:hypothetical protein